MSTKARGVSDGIWQGIDERLKRGDEDRWISSRFAPDEARKGLIALYGFAYELARVRLAVTEKGLGNIRFQWWHDALNELERGEPAREHDVAQAIAAQMKSGRLKANGLHKLIDGYQAAFEADDRAREPEAWIALMAASQLVPAHDWAEEIRDVAAVYSAARRSESKSFGPHVKAAPKAIRPAIAHFRLRKFYCEDKQPNALTKRFSIMKAISTGLV
jgi:hypothetical protein